MNATTNRREFLALAFGAGVCGLTADAWSAEPAANFVFPPIKDLPVQSGLADPFIRHDGSRVENRRDWPAQREYLKAMLEHYQYGHMPPPPKVTLKTGASANILGDAAIETAMTVAVKRKGRSVTVRVAVVRPKRAGRFPVIIKNCHSLFDDKKSPDRLILPEAIRRGYVVCKFIRTDLAADNDGNRGSGVFPLYPEYDWGTIAVWAWGYSVMLAALEDADYADLSKVVATGHSRGGKAALCGGIYEERIALTAPNSSGTGGTGSLRYFEPGQRPQKISAHARRNTHWWGPRFMGLDGREDRVPFDAHTAKALIAPRGLVNAHARQDYWANPYGTQLTHDAARVVFEWLDAGDRIGISWRDGGHAQGKEDWLALLDYADRCFFKKVVKRRFDVSAYPNVNPPWRWKAPPRIAE